MKIKVFVSAAVIVLVVGIGSASAAEQFSTLAGLAPQALSGEELASTRGGGVVNHLEVGGADKVGPSVGGLHDAWVIARGSTTGIFHIH